MRHRFAIVALRTSLIYGAVAAVWILLSDQALDAIRGDANGIGRLQTYKGWVFVGITTVLLYSVLRRQLRRWEQEFTERARVEAALRASEERLAGIVGSAMDAIISIDAAQRIVVFNTAAEQMFGCSAEAVLNQPIDRFIPAPFRGLHAAHIQDFAENGVTSRSMHSPGMLTALRADGTAFPIEATISQTMATGQPLYTVIMRDISARTQAEQALRQSEDRFGKAFHTNPAALAITRLSDGHIIDANASFLQLHGYRLEEVIDHSALELHIFPDPGEFAVIAQLLREKGAIHNRELTIRRKEGQLRSVVFSIEAIEIDGEASFLTLLFDITDRKQAEQALRQSEDRFGKAFRANPAAMSITRLSDGCFIDINASHERLFGYQRDELIGQCAGAIGLYANPDQRAEVVQIMREHGSLREAELTLCTKSGELREVLCSLEALELDGEACILGSVFDITDRKRAEEQLRYQADLLSQVSDAIISTDINFIIKSWNAAATALYGWSAQEVIGKPVREIVPTEYLDSDSQQVQARFFREERWQGEVTQQHRDGTKRSILSGVRLLKDSAGKPVGLVAINRDITERAIAEMALRESEELLRAVTNTAQIGMVIVDREHRYRYANPAYADIFHLPTAEIVGRRVADVLAPVYEAQIRPRLERAFGGEQVSYELVVPPARSGAEERSYAVTYDPGVYRSTTVVVVVVVEITERQRAQAALRRYADRLHHLRVIDQAILASRTLVEIAEAAVHHIEELIPTTRVGVMLLDLDTRTMTVLALQVYGKLHTPSLAQAPLAIFGAAIDTLIHGQLYQVADVAALPEKPAFIRTGQAEQVRAYFHMPIMAGHELIALLNVGSDQTDAFTAEHLEIARQVADQLSLAIQQARLRVQVEHHAQELEQRVVDRTTELVAANHELEAFSYSVSHDLRAPLRAIDGFSRILLEDYVANLPAEAQHYFQLMRSSAQQMGHLIDDLLAFSRLGRQPLSTQSVDTAALVRQCLAELEAEQVERHIQIDIGALPACQGDPALLKQVWINLIANALKYTRRRATAVITIGCQSVGEAPAYFIRDNGVGFDMRYSDKLFGVFQRLHRAEDYEGTGVGLAIVQRIIHRHGGRIWAEAAVDQGATFYFTLGGNLP